MKIYILVKKNEEGEVTTNMPVTFGRRVRAYNNKARAKVYARNFDSRVIEVDLEKGTAVEI